MKNEAEDLVEPVEDQPTPQLMTEATGQALLTAVHGLATASRGVVAAIAVSTAIDCTGTSGLERELSAAKSVADSQNHKLGIIENSLTSIHSVASSTNRHASSTATDISRVVRHVGSIDNDTDSIRDSANSIERGIPKVEKAVKALKR